MIRAKPESWLDVLGDYARNLGYVLATVVSVVYLLGLLVYLVLHTIIGDSFWLLAVINNFVLYYFLPLLVIAPLALIVVRVRWISLLALLLLGVGLIWVGPYFLPKNVTPSTHPTLSITTYNWWRSNTNSTASINWLRELASDIVLLQEVPISILEDLTTLRDIYPYQYNSFPSIAPPYPRGTELGNVTLSVYPLENFTSLPIRKDDPSEVSQQRMELDFAGQRIAIYNVHFALPFDIDGQPRLRLPLITSPMINQVLSYDDGLRDQQILQFLAILEDETLPHLVTGNLNMGDQTDIYLRVRDRLNDTFAEQGWGFGGSWPVGVLPGFVPPLLRIDYIWHSDHFRTVDVWQGPDNLGSDHIPLVAVVEYAGQ